MTRTLPILGLLALLCAACSGASRATNQAAGVGVTTGIAVAAAAINRAATDECWGNCLNGYVCDKTEGVCVPVGELSVQAPPEGDGEDDGCIEEDDGRIVCPDDDTQPGPEVAPLDDDPEVETVPDATIESDPSE